jgi:hypothetical protein
MRGIGFLLEFLLLPAILSRQRAQPQWEGSRRFVTEITNWVGLEMRKVGLEGKQYCVEMPRI